MGWRAWQIDTSLDVPSFTPGNAGDGFFVEQGYGPFPSTLAPANSSTERWSLYLAYNIAPPVFTRVAVQPEGVFQAWWIGDTSLPNSLEASTNLSGWFLLRSNIPGTNGLFQFQDTNLWGFRQRFYRAVVP